MYASICPNCGYVRIKDGDGRFWCPACGEESPVTEEENEEKQIADSAAEFFYNKHHDEHLK